MIAPPKMDVVLIHPADNVCVAARALADGERLAAGGVDFAVRGAIGQGHKVARQAIRRGERVIKYGQTIGFAQTDIAAGDWVHTHNLAAGEFERAYEYATEIPPDPASIGDRTFQGYRRADGRAGTRNYLAVISTVNCSATVSKYVAQRFNRELLKRFPNVDGILPLAHKGGCGMQYDGEDHHQLNRVLAGFARHPNVGAYILIGLGCETGTTMHLIEHEHLVQLGARPTPPPVLSIQECGGTNRTVEAGIRLIEELLPRVNDVRRETIPASELVLGTNCGGSDGNSGVTANPALGVASDLIVACGGTSILGETTEIYGAEHLLTRRARSRAVGEKLIERIRWWEQYTSHYGVKIDNNPSPGNKAGGLTTIYEKSLGAVAKGGSTALAGVFHYAEPVTSRGFVIVDTPGYDPVSMTGIVASGANVACFTTGRGSCYGCKPTPSIKIATNTPLYERMEEDMDVNAGEILSGKSVAEVGREIFELILKVASGQKTKSELHGVGEEEFVPWSIGPTL
ncbi:MAG: altronate dehydratase family protein [Pirellulales bacterium]|nr:altronate dehydratase family protein [Pirellulales bacterium]